MDAVVIRGKAMVHPITADAYRDACGVKNLAKYLYEEAADAIAQDDRRRAEHAQKVAEAKLATRTSKPWEPHAANPVFVEDPLIGLWKKIAVIPSEAMVRLFQQGHGAQVRHAKVVTKLIRNRLKKGEDELPSYISAEQYARLRAQAKEADLRILGNWRLPTTDFYEEHGKVSKELYEALKLDRRRRCVLPVALCGMPGVGKSTLARVYIDQHRHEYATVIGLEGEKLAQLSNAFIELGSQLGLTAAMLGNDDEKVRKVRQHLEEVGGWLIVVDNVEDIDGVLDILPRCPPGRILLTTRLEEPGERVHRIKAPRMDKETGAAFLLRRGRLLQKGEGLDRVSAEVRQAAEDISVRLDGLPLALQHAGACIAGVYTPQTFLAQYENHRRHLLTGGGTVEPPLETVFRMAMEALGERRIYGPAAVRLIQLCAFLGPDSIAKKMIDSVAPEIAGALGPFLEEHEWYQVVRTASEFSLIDHNGDGTLSLHRVVGDMVRDRLPADEQKAITEAFVRVVIRSFPDDPAYDNWTQCATLMPHVEALRRRLFENEVVSENAAEMLGDAAVYLRQRGRYEDARPYYERSLEIRRAIHHGGDHRNLSSALSNFGILLRDTGEYDRAAAVLVESVRMDRRLGPNVSDLDRASHLDQLGGALYVLGRHKQSEKHRREALRVTEKVVGANDPLVSIRLNNLALPVAAQGKLPEALELRERDLRIKEATYGDRHPEYARSLFGNGTVYALGRHSAEAMGLFERALSIFETELGREHSDCASVRYWQARCEFDAEEPQAARAYAQKALELRERVLREGHPETQAVRNLLARIDATLEESDDVGAKSE